MSDATRLTFDQTLNVLGGWEGSSVAVEVLAEEAGEVHSLVHVPITSVGELQLISISDSSLIPNGRIAEYFVSRHARITIDQAFFRSASWLEAVIVIHLAGCVISIEHATDEATDEQPGGTPTLRVVPQPDS